MPLDDLKQIFLSPTLFRLDTILGRRLVPILYATGLAALLLWGVSHLFGTFGRSFGDGLWGLLEIVVFGVLGIVALRIGCEALAVYFRRHDDTVEELNQARLPAPLLDDVADALHELAEEMEPPVGAYADSPPPAGYGATDVPPPPDVPGRTPHRTARRSPPPPPAAPADPE